MKRITPHHLMRGYVLPAMTKALNPHDWPLLPSARVIVARSGDASEALEWGGRLREAYAPHLEAALEQAPFAALAVDALRALILPFELTGAGLAEEEEDEDDPEEAAIVEEVTVEKIGHIPAEVRTFPQARFDPTLVDPRPAVYGPPIQTVAQRHWRRVLRERYRDVPPGAGLLRRHGGSSRSPPSGTRRPPAPTSNAPSPSWPSRYPDAFSPGSGRWRRCSGPRTSSRSRSAARSWWPSSRARRTSPPSSSTPGKCR